MQLQEERLIADSGRGYKRCWFAAAAAHPYITHASRFCQLWPHLITAAMEATIFQLYHLNIHQSCHVNTSDRLHWNGHFIDDHFRQP